MIVLEPGARFDPATDMFFMIGEVNTPSLSPATINRHLTALRLIFDEVKAAGYHVGDVDFRSVSVALGAKALGTKTKRSVLTVTMRES